MFHLGISRDSYLMIVCTGTPVYNDFLALIDLAANVAARENWDRVLVDCSSVSPVFSPDDRTFLGSHAGKALAGRHVALVVSDVKRFFSAQFAAAQSGGTLRYFTNLMDAAAWLASTNTDPFLRSQGTKSAAAGRD